MVCALLYFSSAQQTATRRAEYGFYSSFVFSLFSILLCCWVLFAPGFTVSPVSDFKAGVGSTYLTLSWHLPNPPAYTTSATRFHWCCNVLPTKKATLKYHARFPRVPYSQGTLCTSCLFTMETAVWETRLLWSWEYRGYSDAQEKTEAATYMPHRDVACSEHRTCENP